MQNMRFSRGLFRGRACSRASAGLLSRAGQAAQGLALLGTLVGLMPHAAQAAPFGNGNVVVCRFGNGAGTVVNTGTPVFLDEYTPAGALVQSIALPTTASGAQRQLISSGTSTSEGFLTRSADGSYLVLAGYARDLGGTGSVVSTTAATVPRTIGRVAANGTIDTSTALTDFGSTGNARTAASTDGSALWAAASNNINAATLGNTTSAALGTLNSRVLGIFGGQLYVSSGSGTNTFRGVNTVGTGLPTTGTQTITRLPGLTDANSPSTYGFYLADLNAGVAGLDTLYVADDGAGALSKFSLVSGTWTSNGTIGVAADAYRGLTATVSGTTVTLYATRKAATTSGGELVSLVDSSGYNGTFSGTPTLLASAATGTVMRGVAMAPFVAASNSAPTNIFLSNNSVAENAGANAVVGTLSATDPDAGDTATFSLPSGLDDNASFNISGTSLRATASLNFELKSSYTVTVRVTDSGNLTFNKQFTITVSDVNEAPTDIGLDADNINENAGANAVIGNITGTDPDAGDTLTFSLPAGVDDNAAFNINGTQLRANTSFDFETKNSYTITIRATDANNLTYDEQFTIAINDVNEGGNTAPTDITLSNNTIAENAGANAVVGTLSATDPDTGETFTFSLPTGVDDNASFNISGTGLRANASFNFEVKSSYAVMVRVTDSANNVFDKQFTVTVTDVNEAPTDIALSNASVAENAGANAVIGTLSGTDPDTADTLTFSLPAGVDDNAAFNINGTQLRANASFDFETDASYTVTVRATDANNLTYDEQFTITVTDVNETVNTAPTDITLSNNMVAENAGADAVIGTLSATDPDTGENFTFSLPAGLDDNASFNISGTSLRANASFNFEVKSSYTVTVRVTDSANNTFDKQFAITVTNLNETPTDIALSNNIIAENAGVNAVVGTLSATDPDASDTFTFSLPAGIDDNAAFNINGTSLRANASFDFETDTSYTITVRVTDAGNLTYDEQFTITVNNVNEAPTDIALTNASVAENAGVDAVIGTLSGTDPDTGDTLTFSLPAGLDDNASFNINDTELRANASFNFEAKNSYAVTVRATDANNLTYDEQFTITVTDANEAPVASDVTLTGEQSETFTGSFSATDSDAGNTLTYSIVTGTLPAGLSLNIATGAITGTPTAPANGVNVIYKATDNNGVDSNVATATFNILAAPALSINDVSIAEGNAGTSTLTFTVSLSRSSINTVTVGYTTADNTALQPGDYTSASGTLSFAPGDLTKPISVTIKGDVLDEFNENFFVTLSNATGKATIADNQGIGTITDDDPAPSISINDVSVNETNGGSAQAVLTLTLSAPSAKTITVVAQSSSSAGSPVATVNVDYLSAPAATITFLPGQTTRPFNVTALGDIIDESDEKFAVSLSGAVNATISDNTGVVTIIDNDDPPTISVSAPNFTEGNTGDTGTMVFTIKLSAASARNVSVQYQTANSPTFPATGNVDYTVVPVTTVIFAPGETTKTVNVAIKGDILDEDNERVLLNLFNPVNATLGTISEGIIVDNDATPTLSINDLSVLEGNSGTKQMLFTVTLSAASGRTVTVNAATGNGGTPAATAGTDYVVLPSTAVTFAPGQTSKQVAVTINGDTTVEQNEKLAVILSGAVNATIADNSGIGTILNDDAAQTLPPSLSEASK